MARAGLSHFGSSTAEGGPDAVFRHTHSRADFLVALTFQVVHPDDIRFGSVQDAKETLNLFAAVKPVLVRRSV